MRRLAFLLAVLSCLACLQACVDFDPSNSGGTPPPPRSLPHIAMDFPGGGVAAWNDGSSVVARVYDDVSGTWGPDETIASGLGHVEDVSVAMYGVGRAIVAWQQNDEILSLGYDEAGGGWGAVPTRVRAGLDVEVSSFPFEPSSAYVVGAWREVVFPGAFTEHAGAFGGRYLNDGWQDIRHLDTNPSQTGSRPQNVFNIRVAAGSVATGIAAWQVEIDATGETASFASRYVSGDWEEPVRLGPQPSAPGDPAADGHPDVGMDGDGNALAVFVENGRVMGRRLERTNLNWSEPSQVDDHPGTAVLPRIAVNGDGNAVAVWSKWETGRVLASRYTPGAGWSPSQIIDIDIQGTPTSSANNPPSSLGIGIDADGRARALWTVGTRIWTSAFDGSAWQFASHVGTGRLTDVAMSPSGRAIGVWWNDDGFQSMVWEGPPPPPPAFTGTIVFASDRFSPDFEICTVRVDTMQTTRHTIHAAEDTDPVWSPDGTKVCFVSDGDAPGFAPGATDLYVWDAGGTGQITRLTFLADDGNSARDPAWSHNGLEIAFAGRTGGQESIHVVEVATGDYRPVSGGSNDRWPSWSHDDIHLAYSSGGSDLLLVDAGDGPSQTPIPIVERANTDESPAFSPDGEAIVFAARGPLAEGIQAIDLNTGIIVSLTSTAGDRRPTWSPDGEHIAFVRDGTDGARIWIMDKDGQNAQEIPDQSGNNDDPDWKD